MTKEEAIKLWVKFLESPKVSKCVTSHNHGMTYLQELWLSDGWLKIAKCHVELSERDLSFEGKIKKLVTPYGEYDLTLEEAVQFKTLFNRRDYPNPIPLEELEKLL